MNNKYNEKLQNIRIDIFNEKKKEKEINITKPQDLG